MPSGSKNKELLTVIIFKDAGKVRRFVLSSRLLVCASLFFASYILAGIYFTNKYLDARGVKEIQADKIAGLSRELLKATGSLQRSRQHIALLDDYLREREEQGPGLGSMAGYTDASIVGIEDLRVKRDRSAINFVFRIVNTHSNDEPIEGYIFVLASGKDSDRSETCVYPNAPLKHGVPADYTTGHRFSIQNFMPISSKLRLSKSIDKPVVLEILVYDTDGTLILKKDVEA